MLESFKYGLSVVGRRSLLVIILFLYEMVWGFVLFRYVKSVVTPLLYRYPGADAANWSSLFWIEGEFRLMKTNMAAPYVLTLLAILAARMLITPLINAGLFHAVHHVSVEQWRAFRTGIRTLLGKFFVLYFIQMIISLAPLYWLVSPVIDMVRNGTYGSFRLMDSALYLIGYMLYLALIRLCFMYLQFAAASGGAWGETMMIWLRRLLPLIGLSTCILLIAVVFQSLLTAASMIWAGLAALIIYQATPLIRVLFQVWEIASQHDLWFKNRKFSDR